MRLVSIAGWVLVVAGLGFAWMALDPWLGVFDDGPEGKETDALIEESKVPGIASLVLLTVGGVLVAMGQTNRVTVKIDAGVKVRCSACRALTDEGAEFCPSCGQPL